MMIIMRYPKGHKAAVKERIVQLASQSFRRHGLGGVSIPDLMKQAGLTHGGFYSYFKNRSDLVAQAIQLAALETGAMVFADAIPMRETLDRYLSKEHLDHPENGCVLAALGSDGPRQPVRIRKAFAEVARGFLRLTARKLDPGAREDMLTDAALVGAATMVGGVILARLVHDDVLAERILAACRR